MYLLIINDVCYLSLVETLLKLAVKLGCYKLSLDADDQVKSFYEKFGFRDGATLFMQLRFFD